ncbi:TetR/AcrR family transcriptional regulator C-terminal domain-containing protein [Streptosporangium sp. NPDC020072]|uniref:TetR family transcriptional regulator n=1 Tax=Streptosporangium jomthongense TaxID=1193683 RepID=A0ABV8F577_9ACTN
MPLRQADVLRGAMELLDEVGLDELTTRRLADRLGVRVGALYWHYPSKTALLDALVERIVDEMLAEPIAEQDWAGRLRELAVRARSTMLAHRDGARLVASFSVLPASAVTYFQALVDSLRTAGVPERDAELGADLLTSFTNGFTLEEQARQAKIWPRDRRDETFLSELDILINGIRVSLLEK